MAAGWAGLASVAFLGGCCLSSISGTNLESGTSGGIEGSSGSSGSGHASGTSGVSSSGSTTGTAVGNTGSSSGTGTGTAAAGTGASAATIGTTTGGFPVLAPAMLLEASARQVFGPVAISATVEPQSFGSADLVYSLGDFQHFDVTLQPLLGDGGPMGAPLSLASTSFGLASPGPQVSVSENGTQTSVCWEDFGSVPVQQSCVRGYSVGPVILCAAIPEDAPSPEISYSDCGTAPRLVFNASDVGTRLLYAGDHPLSSPDFLETSLDSQPACFASLDFGESAAAVPGPSSGDLIWMTAIDAGPNHQPDPPLPGLSFFQRTWDTSCDVQNGVVSNVDPFFATNGIFAVASSAERQLAAAIELDSHGLRAIVAPFDGDAGSMARMSPSEPAVGPLAAARCPSGFGYVAVTEEGAIFSVEQGFDGKLVAGSDAIFSPGGFTSAPGSVALAPNTNGGLFLAVSSATQMGVYLIGCQ